MSLHYESTGIPVADKSRHKVALAIHQTKHIGFVVVEETEAFPICYSRRKSSFEEGVVNILRLKREHLADD